MMRIITLSLLLCALMFSKHSVAQEIVDTEWSGNLLTITYSPTKGLVSCTAYNSEGEGIGGSVAMSVGGVAIVTVEVPDTYAGKQLRLECSSPNADYWFNQTDRKLNLVDERHAHEPKIKIGYTDFFKGQKSWK